MRGLSAVVVSTLATLGLAASDQAAEVTVDWGLPQGDKRKLIPERFQGEWDYSPRACRSYAPDHGYIRANRFRFGDSVSAVKKVIRTQPRVITLLVETRSDGDPWTGEMQLELSPAGDQITIRRGTWSSVRFRCPTRKPGDVKPTPPVPPMPVAIPKAIQLGPVNNGYGFGSCLAKDGEPIDLMQVRFIDAAEIEVETSTGSVRAKIDFQWLLLKPTTPSPGQSEIILNIGDLMGQNGQRSDVAVKFAWLGPQLLLYWRETFQHRPYRQGLQRLLPTGMTNGKGDALTPLCSGNGGSEKSYDLR